MSKFRSIKIRVNNNMEYQGVLRALFDDGCYWSHNASRIVDVYNNEVGLYVNHQGGVYNFLTEMGFEAEEVTEVFFVMNVKVTLTPPVRESVRVGVKAYDKDLLEKLIANAGMTPVDY